MTDETYYSSPDPNLKGKGHVEDILCMVLCTNDFIATCSYDGTIIIWKTDNLTENLRLAGRGIDIAFRYYTKLYCI